MSKQDAYSPTIGICRCVREMGFTEFESPSFRAVGVTAGTRHRKWVALKACPECAGTGISMPGYGVIGGSVEELRGR